MARNAHKEQAFGFLPVLAHPIGGTTHEAQIFDYAVGFGNVADELAMTTSRQAFVAEWLPAAERDAWHTAHGFIRCDDPQVTVSAVKHAQNGAGLIVRLSRPHAKTGEGTEAVLSCVGKIVRDAWLSDARETDSVPLEVSAAGTVRVPMRHGLSTVRLRLDDEA